MCKKVYPTFKVPHGALNGLARVQGGSRNRPDSEVLLSRPETKAALKFPNKLSNTELQLRLAVILNTS